MPRSKVFENPPINITCPYCGRITFISQPNLGDDDYLMDEDCNECGERIFSTFAFVPVLTAVFRLTSSQYPINPTEAAHANV